MKKRVFAFLLVMVVAFALVIPAYGAQPRALQIYPSLSFSGKIATCGVRVIGDNSTDKISAVLELWNGNLKLESWNVSGTYYINFSDTTSVTKGESYVLKVYVTINGVSKPMVSTSGTCPAG